MSEGKIENSDQPSTEEITTQTVPSNEPNGAGEATQKQQEVQPGDKIDKSEEEIKQQKIQANQNEVNNEQAPNKATKKGKGKKEQVLEITVKELKKMNKKILQLDTVKQEYEKMRKNYQLLRADRDQHKSASEQMTNKYQQLISKLQDSQNQLTSLKQVVQKVKKEKEALQKSLEEARKIEQKKQALQQKLKQLEMIIDMTTNASEQTKKSQQKWKAETEKYRDLLRLERDTTNNQKTQIEKLRSVVGQTFVLKQQLNRINGEYEAIKAEKQQMPIMIDKFQHQEQMIAELKEKLKQMQEKHQEAKQLNEKFQKKVGNHLEEKKQIQKKLNKARIQLQESYGQIDALKQELQDEKNDWQVQKKRYTSDIKTLRTQLHNQHEKLKITEWQLTESRKKEKKPVQLQRVNIHSLSKEDLLNYIQEMEMKNQSLKLNLNGIAHQLHQKDSKIKQQQASIMSLARQMTKDYPNYMESQGMQWVQKEILDIGKQKKDDWGEIVEKVMIENLRLKYSVTALGEQYNQKLRKDMQK